jgi:hypothetical protein
MTDPPGRHAASSPWNPYESGSSGSYEAVPYNWPEPPREDLRPELREDPWTDYAWVDGAAGPVVRPYAMTGGRVVPASDKFDVVAMVVANRAALSDVGYGLQPEHRAILACAREPLAVAEVAAHLDLALGVVRVLLGDLLGQGLIEMYHPPAEGRLPSESVLKAVINGLRAL